MRCSGDSPDRAFVLARAAQPSAARSGRNFWRLLLPGYWASGLVVVSIGSSCLKETAAAYRARAGSGVFISGDNSTREMAGGHRPVWLEVIYSLPIWIIIFSGVECKSESRKFDDMLPREDGIT